MYKKIEKLMNDKGITAYQLSKETGIKQSQISEWKNGRYKPGLSSLVKLADYFKVPIEYFVEE